MIIGPNNSKSKQIDIVIYDSSFPILGSALGASLYFIEGTIVTIEVKSILNREELKKGLENCYSVLKISSNKKPKTYIFGYEGVKSPETMCDIVDNWFDGIERTRTITNLDLPNIIIGGNIVGFSKDESVILALEKDQSDKHKGEVKMLFRRTEHQFGIFLSHIINAVLDRLDVYDKKADKKFRDYLPLLEYYEEIKNNENTPYIT